MFADFARHVQRPFAWSAMASGGLATENTKTQNESIRFRDFVLSWLSAGSCDGPQPSASWTPIESIDSLTATVDNQGEMFLAAASLVLISVGISLPTITG
jgi:hypothetical protein